MSFDCDHAAGPVAREFNLRAEPLDELLRVSRLLFPRCELVLHPRAFEDVRVHFYLPMGIYNPWALNDAALHTPNKIIRQTWMLYSYRTFVLPLPPRDPGDGASIPWLAQLLWGYEPFDDSLWAADPHDYICKHPEVLPRAIGDAIFGHVMECVYREKKRRRRDALNHYWAVRIYTRLLEAMRADSR